MNLSYINPLMPAVAIRVSK